MPLLFSLPSSPSHLNNEHVLSPKARAQTKVQALLVEHLEKQVMMALEAWECRDVMRIVAVGFS